MVLILPVARSLPSMHRLIAAALRTAPGEAAELVESRVVGLEVGEQRLERHGAGDLGLAQQAVGVVQQQGAHGREHVGAVDRAQAVAGLKARDRDAGALHGDARGDAFTLVERLTFAHQRERELGHRGKVAARADRALLADDRGHAPVEHRDKGQGDLGSDARVAVGVDVDAAGHGRAHHLGGRRLADAGRVVVDERPLEQPDLLVGEHDLRELAYSGVGAVHDLVGGELVFEHRAAHTDPLQRSRVELDCLATAGDAHESLDRQRAAVKNDGHCVFFPYGVIDLPQLPGKRTHHLDHRPVDTPGTHGPEQSHRDAERVTPNRAGAQGFSRCRVPVIGHQLVGGSGALRGAAAVSPESLDDVAEGERIPVLDTRVRCVKEPK